MTKIMCIYHGNCADGFTAAWAVRKALGNDVEFHPGVYGDAPPDVAGKHVVMVDFSYKRPVIESIADAAASLLILDHHKTAAEDLHGYPPPITRNSWENHLADVSGRVNDGTDPRLPRVVFDMDKSGARLAWEFFHPNSKVPRLVEIVEDRDLWRFALPGTREIMAAIFSYEYNFNTWQALYDRTISGEDERDLYCEGVAIERKHFKDIREFIAVAQHRMTIAGHDIPALNAPYFWSSDAGHIMAQGEPFAACYWETPRGRVFSLRSSENGADVSVIAKSYGGGGHRNAAGFTMPTGWAGDA